MKMQGNGHPHQIGNSYRQGKEDIDYNKNPFIVIWEVTRACQLKCVHCRADAQPVPDPRELTHEEGIKLIDEIYEMNNPLLVFTGGDCMMREDLFELADYAIKKGMRVSISPSATPNVTKEKMEKAKQVGLSRWSFSLDGPTPEIHDRFRGTPGSFELTIEKIKYLNELNMPLQINTVISRYNYGHLEEMAKLVADLKAVMWYIFLLVSTGRAQMNDCITPAEHEKLFRWLYELSKTAPYDIKTTAAQHYRRVVLQQKMREHKIKNGEIRYEDTITTDTASMIDGLKRAPKGVNDGNGSCSFLTLAMSCQAACFRLYAETFAKLRFRKFTESQRYLKICASLTNTKENAAFANFVIFVAVPAPGRTRLQEIIWKANHSVCISRWQ
jgi:MoaA/NifB/PqqE/SkfB family radical SAM enzyme